MLLATPPASGSPRSAEESPPKPSNSPAAPAFAPPAAELASPFSPALEAQFAAGVPVAGEARPEASRPEAPPPPPPEPVVDLGALRGDLQGTAGRRAGRYGVVVFDPDSRDGVSLGGHEAFTAASVGKLPTLLALYRAAARGDLELDEKISILPRTTRATAPACSTTSRRVRR